MAMLARSSGSSHGGGHPPPAGGKAQAGSSGLAVRWPGRTNGEAAKPLDAHAQAMPMAEENKGGESDPLNKTLGGRAVEAERGKLAENARIAVAP